jgi:hydrogenase expression/formation protein HypE
MPHLVGGGAKARGLITLAHGNGGRFMRELIRDIFAKHFGADSTVDAALLPRFAGEAVFTTDGFIVDPLEFPGGDIGTLAVHGTVNDLAVSGATPRFLAVTCLIEEGFEMARLDRIARSLGGAARDCGVAIVAGDTKVLPRGQGGGLYLSVAGIGSRNPGAPPGLASIRPGDSFLVSGTLGDHGTAILLARHEFGLHGDLISDCASVVPFTSAAEAFTELRFMRDPTRGGIATVANEISLAAECRVTLEEKKLPLHEQVRGICDILGYDPLYLACEGRVVAVIASGQAAGLLAAWRALPGGERAAIVGQVEAGPARVVLRTALGGERILDELEDDPLPRIC